MLVLPTLAAPPLRPPPRLAPPPPASFSSWNWRPNRKLLQPGPFATAADAPRGRGGPLPEPEERDQLFLAALHAARLRDEESRRPDPLFIDPYAVVLLSLDVAHQAPESLISHLMPCPDHYRITTRYVDDKLQNLITSSDNFRQMEWTLVHIGCVGQGCLSCTMYHLEESSVQQPSNSEGQELKYPGIVFCFILLQSLLIYRRACAKMASTEISRACGYCRFSGEFGCYVKFCNLGLPMSTSSSLENLLLVISNLAMKGSIFIGELTHFPDWTAAADMVSGKDRLENLFFTQGFQVSFVHYENVAHDLSLVLASPRKQCGRVLFVAEQLRFSDAQLENFRMHFERTQDDADEEGFEEL